MSNDSASKPAAPKAKKRTFTVTVGLSTVISSILVVCTGFVAMFALGVLLGRGYDPEAGIPELERMMPQPGRPTAPIVISEGEGQDAVPAPAPSENSGILGQGDLAYPDSLRTPHRGATSGRQDPPRQTGQTSSQTTSQTTSQTSGQTSAQTGGQTAGQSTSQTARAGQPSKQQEAAKPATAQRGAAGGSGASGTPGLTPLPLTGTAPVRTSAQNQAGAASGDQQVYHYSYQTAAYKDEASSDRFAAKLKNAGLKAHTVKSTDKGVTWYRVMVDFTGRPDDTDALRARLQNLGAGKPIMKSKVPAP